MAVNIKEIATYVAANNNISKLAAETIVKDTFAYIRDSLPNDEVVVHGFGKFALATRSARVGRNPSTGAPIQIAETKVVKFKPTTSFKAEVK